MSVSGHARLVHGFRFEREDTIVYEQVRACKHSIPDDAKFCPECGKPAFEEKQTQLIYDGDSECKPFECFIGNSDVNGEGRFKSEYYVIGRPIRDGFLDPETVSVASSDALEREISEKLTSMGIDTALGVFGYHVVHLFG